MMMLPWIASPAWAKELSKIHAMDLYAEFEKKSCLLWAATRRTRRFSEPTFRPSRPTNHRKTQHFATFLTFSACVSSFFWSDFRSIVSSFFWHYFSSLLFHLLTLLLWSAFQLSILSEFFTSKLPLISLEVNWSHMLDEILSSWVEWRKYLWLIWLLLQYTYIHIRTT